MLPFVDVEANECIERVKDKEGRGWKTIRTVTELYAWVAHYFIVYVYTYVDFFLVVFI